MKIRYILGTASVLLAALVLIPLLIPDSPWPVLARDMLFREGFRETGAPNLVASIYLGYRLFDTIGETLVLLTALSGTIALITPKQRVPGSDAGVSSKEKKRQARTNIIDFTTGKIAPMVLLLGWYVMFFGHQSPGGGFQGGVVIASGIIFIAIGRREGGVGKLGKRLAFLGNTSLLWIEVAAFIFVLALCFSGLWAGRDMLANPFVNSNLPRVLYIVAFNIGIGLKVSSGIALVCLLMMGSSHD